MDYSLRLRCMLLAAQVGDYCGTSCDTLAEPLARTVTAEGPKEPGWLKQVEYWEQQNEALVAIVYGELRTFESKYWTMVESAGDQNFWLPVAST